MMLASEYEELVNRVAQEVVSRIQFANEIDAMADQAIARMMPHNDRKPTSVGNRTSITDGMNGSPRKLILRSKLSPGDIVMLTAAVRDLHLTYPGRFITDVRTPSGDLWENNPYITSLPINDSDIEVIDCEYPLISRSNQLPFHFVHAYRMFLNETLNLDIQAHAFKGDIHLRNEEREWMSQVDEITGANGTPFWIIVSGGKRDFTNKWWDPARYQKVVDHFRGRLTFVQVGEDKHVHPPLEGVINLLGKTDLRQLVRLMYHADGVVCGVTLLMHLAAAVECKPGRPQNRPCVVIAGGREPSHWEAYPHHQFLHTNGALNCCDAGGCWKSRIRPLEDDDEKNASLCERPVPIGYGSFLPQCLDMITADDVIRAIELYLNFDRPAPDPITTSENKKDFEDEVLDGRAVEPAEHTNGHLIGVGK